MVFQKGSGACDWLARGNVLRGFRLTIDFPRRTTYWERVSDLDLHELDQVGVTLEKRSDGYFIAGIAQKSGKPTVDTVRVGDKLIQVDDVVLSSATRGAIFAALHGKPGEVRTPVVEKKMVSAVNGAGEGNCFLKSDRESLSLSAVS